MKRAVNVIMSETERSTVVHPLGKGGALEDHVRPERAEEICRKITDRSFNQCNDRKVTREPSLCNRLSQAIISTAEFDATQYQPDIAL
jgi:hypothetical protein